MSGCLGPLPDLEPHLPPDWWRHLFGEWYLRTDGDVVENEANTRADVDLVTSVMGLRPTDHVLDLCCGQGRHVLELARRGFGHVTGLDASSYLIGLARQRAADAGLAVEFVEGDARETALPPASFDAVMLMGNSFGYHHQEADDQAVLAAVRRVLRPGGRLALDLTDGEWVRTHFEPRSWEWMDATTLVCRERQLAADGRRLVCREVIVDANRGVVVDQFYAERLYGRAEIRALLEAAGFEAVAFQGNVESASDRNQDLGMMANRVFVTARVRHVTPVGPRPVIVLLGDLDLPDEVKRGGHSNAEDHETVARLKAALQDLPGYRFTFLERHAEWLDALTAGPPGLVLNLCDEGFRNRAEFELHVPALLELLGLPYTGSGPSCLALCYDKRLVRALAHELGIPVPAEVLYAADEAGPPVAPGFPAIVKPSHGDGSYGIPVDAVVQDQAGLVAWLARFRERWPGRAALVQEYLPGPEYTVGMVGGRMLPILQPDFGSLEPPILGWESKYCPDSPYWDIPMREANLAEHDRRKLVAWSQLLFDRLGCRDYARCDFRTDVNGEIRLLEVNPNPGWCWDGKLVQMAALAGMSYAELVSAILASALARYEARRPAAVRGTL